MAHDVKVFYSGGTCLREALEWKPTIAFLDIGLPDMTGYGVARQLRAAFGADVMLVAVTGYDSVEDRTVSAEAGFDMHLAKPVQLDRLISIAATEVPAVIGQSATGQACRLQRLDRRRPYG